MLIANASRPGGIKALIAENLILKNQLSVLSRARQKAPNLTAADRFLFGMLSLGVARKRLRSVAIVIKPSTLLNFHRALVKRKYRRLFGNRGHRRPGPGVAVCRMFNHAISGSDPPRYLSSDNDPLFRFHRWRANLRILEVTEIKSLPYAPMSHPFIERVIGTIRREYLDHVPFWNSLDLERKLDEFKDYYNNHRTHAALSRLSPTKFGQQTNQAYVNINDYGWQQHCRGLFHTPIPA
ncbi:MAG: integrase core domain-containing protein [bacterium]